MGTRRFNFETLTEIKRTVTGATINDVVLAIVSGGLRRYLQGKGELPQQSLVSGCPVNVRTDQERGLAGNACDWCADLYNPDDDGADPAAERALRGGSWYLESWSARAADRNGSHPGYRGDGIGFRVLLELRQD